MNILITDNIPLYFSGIVRILQKRNRVFIARNAELEHVYKEIGCDLIIAGNESFTLKSEYDCPIVTFSPVLPRRIKPKLICLSGNESEHTVFWVRKITMNWMVFPYLKSEPVANREKDLDILLLTFPGVNDAGFLAAWSRLDKTYKALAVGEYPLIHPSYFGKADIEDITDIIARSKFFISNHNGIYLWLAECQEYACVPIPDTEINTTNFNNYKTQRTKQDTAEKRYDEFMQLLR